MKLTKIFICCGLVLAFAGIPSVFAQNADQETRDRVETALRTLIPKVQIDAIADSQVPGLLQVTVGSQVVYVSDDGRYLVQGSIFDMENQVDVTEQSKAVLRRGKVAAVGQEQTIRFAPEQPDYEIMVFTDIDCGYCRRLHQKVPEYNELGIAINYVFFPRSGIGSESYNKAVSVWCAQDSRSAMTVAKSGGEPEPQSCENPVAAQYQLGQEIGVTGTPALITEDGDLIAGFMQPEVLRKRLDQLHKSGS